MIINKIEQVCQSMFECDLTPFSWFFFFQMLQDCAKARREVELHWRASHCANIVRIIDVYENLYQGRKCLLIVMEWWAHTYTETWLQHLTMNMILFSVV